MSSGSSLTVFYLSAVEGWIIFVRNVHEEAQEDDIVDKFSEFGAVKNIQLNLDRRTGFVKVVFHTMGFFIALPYPLPILQKFTATTSSQGYALIEFAEHEEAENAIRNMNGAEILGLKVDVYWAFSK